jgi:hypothetical protein
MKCLACPLRQTTDQVRHEPLDNLPGALVDSLYLVELSDPLAKLVDVIRCHGLAVRTQGRMHWGDTIHDDQRVDPTAIPIFTLSCRIVRNVQQVLRFLMMGEISHSSTHSVCA